MHRHGRFLFVDIIYCINLDLRGGTEYWGKSVSDGMENKRMLERGNKTWTAMCWVVIWSWEYGMDLYASTDWNGSVTELLELL